MVRSRALIARFVITAFLAVVAICIIIVACSRVSRQREDDRRTIQEALERQKIKHQTVEYARARLPQDSRLASNWSLGQAITAWQSTEIEAFAELAKRFSQQKGHLSADDKRKLTHFVANSPELHELLEAIEHGLCEITLEPAKGQWQVSNAQIEALKSMTYLLAARVILLAESADKEGALKAVLSGYALMDVLLDAPNVKLQSYRPGMLLYLGYAIHRGLSADEIPNGSKVVLLRYLQRQSSEEPIVNALKLHEALVRQEVSAKHSTLMTSWLLAGYHDGIKRVTQSLDRPGRNVSKQCGEILDKAPLYAGQTKWRLQNVAPDALHVQTNTRRHVTSVCEFLGLNTVSDIPSGTP